MDIPSDVRRIMMAPDAQAQNEYRTVNGKRHLAAVIWSSKSLGKHARVVTGVIPDVHRPAPSEAGKNEKADTGPGDLSAQAEASEPDERSDQNLRRAGRHERKE